MTQGPADLGVICSIQAKWSSLLAFCRSPTVAYGNPGDPGDFVFCSVAADCLLGLSCSKPLTVQFSSCIDLSLPSQVLWPGVNAECLPSILRPSPHMVFSPSGETGSEDGGLHTCAKATLVSALSFDLGWTHVWPMIAQRVGNIIASDIIESRSYPISTTEQTFFFVLASFSETGNYLES